MKNIFILLSCLILLSGCSSQPRSKHMQECIKTTEKGTSARWNCIQSANLKEKHDKDNLEQELFLKNANNKCVKFGFKENTNEFSNCILRLQIQEENKKFNALQEDQRRREKFNRDLKEIFDTKPATICTKLPNGITSICN